MKINPIHRRLRGSAPVLAAMTVAASSLVIGGVAAAQGKTASSTHSHDTQSATKTPIKHVVVIFDENVSFDHYFGTYPYAQNPPNEPKFHALPGTPTVNGLYSSTDTGSPTGPLLTANPNSSNPLRLDRTDPMTCDQNHGYVAEQLAADHGAEDLYVQNTGRHLTVTQCLANESYNGTPEPVPASSSTNYAVMDYYDGNTVTALWNYAQHYALSDNNYGTTFGPSTPGALNVTSAQTYGALCGPSFATINDAPCAAPTGYNAANVASSNMQGTIVPTASQPAAGPGTDYSDADPNLDVCSYMPNSQGGDGGTPASTIQMGGNNIGEELSTSGLTWGWFQGGFSDGYVPGHGVAPTTSQICAESHMNVGGKTISDYIPHHNPFQYYASTANPMHLPPSSIAMIGHNDQANHQYGLNDFWAAADQGNLPAVSYLKAAGYQDGHAGYSDPLDEQNWLVNTINHIQKLPQWRSTAIVITWDDSDGWYDHVLGPITSQSQSPLDVLTGVGQCGSNPSAVPTTATGTSEQGKCGLGPRIPLLVISPWSKSNFVDHTVIDQSSVVKFIEYNWGLQTLGNGAADTSAGSITSMFNFTAPTTSAPLLLDPNTGETIRDSNS